MRIVLACVGTLAVLAGGCATTAPPPLQARKIAIVEPAASDLYVRLGSAKAAMPGMPATHGRGLPLDMALVESTLIAGLDAAGEKTAAGVTERMRAACPDVTSQSDAIRQRALARLREALSERFEATTLSAAEYGKLQSDPSEGIDAYVHFTFDASLWAATPFMDYWPALRAIVAVETGDRKKVTRPAEIRAFDRSGKSFPNGDDVVARCHEAIAAVDALVAPFAANIKTHVVKYLQEKP